MAQKLLFAVGQAVRCRSHFEKSLPEVRVLFLLRCRRNTTMPGPPKKIINDPKDSVGEFIDGLLLQYPNKLQKLQNHHVVLAAHPNPNQVQLLSGGGSGHEPSHAGWIGEGMLSGAICGGIFASPSVAAILAAIRAANTGKGVLLIIKNYTGDRLNFGMACETANQEGIRCEMVVVADDCALPRTKGITGARGVAGTVLVHKVAGAAAKAGKSMEEIIALAKEVSANMGTLGVSLDCVTVPGASTVNDRLDGDKIELGLGIHGEAGMRQVPIMTANEMAKEMVETILAFGNVSADGSIVPTFTNGDNLCVLVNNLGGTSNFEMSILARSVVTYIESTHGVSVSRLMVGSVMTAFDMHGASITILNLSRASATLVSMLDAPTSAPAWIHCDIVNSESRPSSTERPEVVVDQAAAKADVDLPAVGLADFSVVAAAATKKAAELLGESEPLLTKYDTIVGDGDCGITMKRGATEVLQRLANGGIPTNHPVPMFAAMADAVSASMGGTSGVLIELMFRKMSSVLARSESPIGPVELAAAFQAGTDAICLYGGATIGSRTMLDALIPAAKALVATQGNLPEAATQARQGADGTASIKVALAGRSNYLSEDTLAGTPDPGAIAVAIVLEALASSA